MECFLRVTSLDESGVSHFCYAAAEMVGICNQKAEVAVHVVVQAQNFYSSCYYDIQIKQLPVNNPEISAQRTVQCHFWEVLKKLSFSQLK